MNLQKVAKVKLEKTTSYQVLYCFFVWITVSAFYAAIQCFIVHLMKAMLYCFYMLRSSWRWYYRLTRDANCFLVERFDVNKNPNFNVCIRK